MGACCWGACGGKRNGGLVGGTEGADRCGVALGDDNCRDHQSLLIVFFLVFLVVVIFIHGYKKSHEIRKVGFNLIRY